MQPCSHELAQNITLLVLLQPQHTSKRGVREKGEWEELKCQIYGKIQAYSKLLMKACYAFVWASRRNSWLLLTASQQFQRVNSSIRISASLLSTFAPCIAHSCVISIHAICSCSLPFLVWDSAPQDSQHQVPCFSAGNKLWA